MQVSVGVSTLIPSKGETQKGNHDEERFFSFLNSISIPVGTRFGRPAALSSTQLIKGNRSLHRIR